MFASIRLPVWVDKFDLVPDSALSVFGGRIALHEEFVVLHIYMGQPDLLLLDHVEHSWYFCFSCSSCWSCSCGHRISHDLLEIGFHDAVT